MSRPPLFPTIEKGGAAWLANADMCKAARTDLEADLLSVARDLQAADVVTIRAIAGALKLRGISTARGGGWDG